MTKVWSSSLTSEQCAGITPDELELLIADLNDAVQGVCEDWGVGEDA
jgi:hypothetical protein